ncbi:MAG: 4Fe-4S binding protein [Exilispira sp.]
MIKRQKIRILLLLISFFLFPAVFYYMSPVLIIEATTKGIISGSFLLFSLQFLSSLIVGRAFCGWVCPAGGAQEALSFVLSKKVSKLYFLKWIIWTPWIIIIFLIAIKNGGYNSIDPFFQTELGLSITSVYSLIIYLMILLLVTILSIIVGKRSFCHHVCWMAPFMITGRKIRNLLHIPSLQLKPLAENCIHCHLCSEKCPMSLDVENMVKNKKMENSECILCLNCVDVCKSKAIKTKFK